MTKNSSTAAEFLLVPFLIEFAFTLSVQITFSYEV